jgi:hypothetical protein
MQNTLYQWFLCACLSFLPMGSNANIAAPKAKTTASATAIWAGERRHFPKVNPLDRFRILEKWQYLPKKGQKIAKNRVFTEGGDDDAKAKKSARRRRIFYIILAIIAGILLISLLQGSIWLSVVTLGIVSYFTNRNKISEWERRRYERQQNPDVAADTVEELDDDGNIIKKKIPLSHPSNKWTRRAVNRFVIGLIAPTIGGIFALLGIFGSNGLVFLGLGLVAVGAGFLLVSIVNAFQALNAKEPRRKYAKLILIVGLLLIMQYVLPFVFG